MNLTKLLEDNLTQIISESFKATRGTHLRHYESMGEKETQERLTSLLQLTVKSIKEKNLTLLISYANKIASDRFNAGFALYEVQTVFNVLEESIWKLVLNKMSPADFPEAIGMVSTVLGAGKDALARTYVALASKTKVTSLDLKAMFEGTAG